MSKREKLDAYIKASPDRVAKQSPATQEALRDAAAKKRVPPFGGTTQLTITLHPIETAPRDGEPFFVVRKFDRTTGRLRWNPDYGYFETVGYLDIYPEHDMGTFFSHWFRLGGTEPTTGE